MASTEEINGQYKRLPLESPVKTIVDCLKLAGFILPGRLFDLKPEAASVVVGLNRGEKDGKYIGVPRFLSRSGKKIHLVVLCTNGVQEKLFALGPEECVRWKLSSRMSRRS